MIFPEIFLGTFQRAFPLKELLIGAGRHTGETLDVYLDEGTSAFSAVAAKATPTNPLTRFFPQLLVGLNI